MVHGLDKFKEYFRGYTNQYVFIGGTACDILLNEAGGDFRATKDLDLVLIVEALDSSFGETFWKFVEDGGYEHREKNDGENQFYRFTKPNDPSFPKMIELFSRKPNNFDLKFDNGLTPVHIDESIVSLSAILLNDVYYDTLIKGKRTLDGYSVIEIETVILFKIKAWIDLEEKKDSGEKVDSKNIKKHKNDIFRLLAYVNPSSKIDIGEKIENDVIQFIERMKNDQPNLKDIGIRNITVEEMLSMLRSIYINKA